MFARNISTSRKVMFGNRYTGSPASLKLVTKQKRETAQRKTKVNKSQSNQLFRYVPESATSMTGGSLVGRTLTVRVQLLTEKGPLAGLNKDVS